MPMLLAMAQAALAAIDSARFTRAALIIFVGFALLVGAMLVFYLILRRWRRSLREEGPASGEVLSQFRDLHLKGELSREEFERIRQRIAQKLHRDLTDASEDTTAP